MSQLLTPQLKDNFCNNCGHQEMRFLHLVWHEDRVQSLCTSCVLHSNTRSFCPTCFSLHEFNVGEMFIRCAKCLSFSHPTCFASNGSSSSRPPSMCSSCINPNRLASALGRIKAMGGNGSLKGMDKDSADLLLAAAKIAMMSISKAVEASKDSAYALATKTVLAKKKASAAVNHVVEYGDREKRRQNGGKGNDDDGPSLLDFSSDDTETDEDIRYAADYDIENQSEDDAI